MDAGKNYKSLSKTVLRDCRCPVRVLADNVAPPRKLGAILPIDVELAASRKGNLHCFYVDAFELVGKKVKPDARGQIQAVVN
jgi:hypothetical protein